MPDGLQTRKITIGLRVALAATALAFALRQLWSLTPGGKVLLAVGGLALIRSVADFWLPRIGSGLTRSHVESLPITEPVVVAAGAMLLRSYLRLPRLPTTTWDPHGSRDRRKSHRKG